MTALLAAIAAVAVISFPLGAADIPPEVAGRWAMLQVTTDIVDYPIVGRRIRETYLVLAVQIEQSGTELLVHEQHCLAYIDDGTPLVESEISEAFLRSMGILEYRGQLRQDADGWRLILPWGTKVHGARLENPEQDELPTDPADPRVFDQDEDGNPGVTVGVTILGVLSGEVYAVQRLSKHMEGAVDSSDRVKGLISWTNEQVALAASSPLLQTTGEAEVHPDAERSYFVMKRIPEHVGCQTLREEWRELFGL